MVGVLSGGEQSSDVESGSSSEELMKHRPQGSLGDSSCQDLIELGDVHIAIVHLQRSLQGGEQLMQDRWVLEQSW